MTEASGQVATVAVQEYTVDGERTSTGSYAVAHDGLTYHNTHHSLTGPFTDNGWARIEFSPAGRVLHAVAMIWHRERPGLHLSSQVLKPAPAFRLFGELSKEGETGIAIVNPTAAPQAVTVSFLRHSPAPQRTVERVWTLEPLSKVSRFLSQLVALEGTEDDPGAVTGLVRIQGESVIAVGALWHSREIDWFQTILVTAEALP